MGHIWACVSELITQTALPIAQSNAVPPLPTKAWLVGIAAAPNDLAPKGVSPLQSLIRGWSARNKLGKPTGAGGKEDKSLK